MKSIYTYFSSFLVFLLLSAGSHAQDTLRTYGPRFGIDLARFIYYFSDPAETGASFSADLEVVDNFYMVAEAGFSALSDSVSNAGYSSSGSFARIGLDYNILPVPDRSVHHSITAGFRYGISRFEHSAHNVVLPSSYWGDYTINNYENQLTGHWFELVGGITAEIFPNFFMGWSVRYRILLNPGLDPQVAPLLIPGYGKGTQERGLGFTYSVYYRIPLWKK
jgi:hypothetical protein